MSLLLQEKAFQALMILSVPGLTPVAERRNMLYSGCFVSSGTGKAVVTAVGNNTEFGQIAKELSSIEKDTTPLQEKLDRLGKSDHSFIVLQQPLVVFAIRIAGFC